MSANPANGDGPSLSAQNLAYAESIYEDYLKDRDAVSEEWRNYFDEMDGGAAHTRGAFGPSFRAASIFNPANGHAANGHTNGAAAPGHAPALDAELQHRVEKLVRSYRVRGHLIAQLDPLEFLPRPAVAELEPKFYGITDADLDRPVQRRTIYGPEMMTVRGVIERLRNTYCRSVAVQYMHIDDLRLKEWLMARMESTENRVPLSGAEQMRILTKLTDASIFEEFIQKKYVGAKSFSLEGGESLIPLLDLAIEKAGEQGIAEIVLAMAHRGRLNVLANIMGKRPSQIFKEFDDADPEIHIGGGDVKYHLGYSNDHKCESGKSVHLSLCFNPSHLEFVNPVALGRVRAKQDRFQNVSRDRCMALLIHGDAAFAGEGVVQETLNLSQLAGYSVGGTLHVVINNQIGFTTLPSQSKSNTYSTAIAKMLQIPIFHVNGENPEAVATVVKMAMEFRKTFKRDVIVDMFCYRRHGHNEGDEPSYTQPLLYKAIERRKSVREGYLDHLLKLGGVTREEAEALSMRRRQRLEEELAAARGKALRDYCDLPKGIWSGYRGGSEVGLKPVKTSLSKARLRELIEAQAKLPDDFHLHPKLKRMVEQRVEMARGEKPLDWATAEAAAFASLAAEGVRIRMTGQDCERGTFSHRHAVLHDHENGHTHTPLEHIAKGQGPVEIANSPLSEVGVLGFEYGYSLDYPDGLVVWEAQFGDFCNVAQVVIDQFIASAEDKWYRLSGLVLLLPHGFEGLGPEHSSARLERFLALSADTNMQVAVPTTPGQYYHLLRRQALRRWIKPLVVMAPKSLLRDPRCVSPISELSKGEFRRIIGDDAIKPEAVRRVLLCTGKIYYDLIARRDETKRDDVAIIRVEQLYPLPAAELKAALAPYAEKTPVFWVQEEPENMGAWRYMLSRFGESIRARHPFKRASRPESASPATGSMSSHKLEQKMVVDEAFGGA